MKMFAAFVLLASPVAYAQLPPPPGMSPAGQASQAFSMVQAQAMSMTSQAQLQGAIMSQAAMLHSPQAQAMFLGMAAGLQARSMNNQAQMFATQAGITMFSNQAAMHNLMLNQSAILRARTLGIESNAAMQSVVRMASLDQAKMARTSAMVRGLASQAAAGQQKATPQTSGAAVQSAAADAVSSTEPPPMMIRPTFGNAISVDKPEFSVKGGKVEAGTKVKLKSDTHYATLYYTTNGWTPTTQSAKYTGPITINQSTHLQVIAMGPNYMRSAVEQADYDVKGATASAPETTVAVSSDGVLHAGTAMRLVFGGKEIDSETASVGDEITLLLDEDVKLGDKVLAAKGAKVNAALTIADASRFAAPGDLVFEVKSVEVSGKRVPLFGGETLEGAKNGKNAVIKPGMTAMAFVSADTDVKP